jgi:hypothetical protein
MQLVLNNTENKLDLPWLKYLYRRDVIFPIMAALPVLKSAMDDTPLLFSLGTPQFRMLLQPLSKLGKSPMTIV